MRMHRRDFLGSSFAAALSGFALPLTSRASKRWIGYDQQIPAWMKEHDVPGVSVAYVENGALAWSRAFGIADMKSQAKVTPETVFQAASLSKPVFAYAVLTLAADGKFDLDRPLVSYLANPWVSRFPRLMASEVPADARLGKITARIVLRHATGFPNWGRNKPLTISFEPGEKFGYSGEGYTYLQNVIEHVTAEPLAEFLRKRALAPLGMESSSFVWRPDYDARAAIGHDRGSPQEKWRPNVAFAAGTLHTTATDYAKFLAAMIRPRKGVGLDEAWLRRMLTPASHIDDSLSWGLGWGLERAAGGAVYFWQWGDDGEFKAFTAGSREMNGLSGKDAVVILTNGANGLRVCRPVIENALPGPHPFLSYSMVNY